MEVETFVFCDCSDISLLLPSCWYFLRPGSGDCRWESQGLGMVCWSESCHGTQSTYHAKCRRECSSGPGRPSISGKLIVINQVTETEQGLADDHLSPLLLLLPPLPFPFVFFLHLILCFLMWFPSRLKIKCQSGIKNKTYSDRSVCFAHPIT